MGYTQIIRMTPLWSHKGMMVVEDERVASRACQTTIVPLSPDFIVTQAPRAKGPMIRKLLIPLLSVARMYNRVIGRTAHFVWIIHDSNNRELDGEDWVLLLQSGMIRSNSYVEDNVI